MSTSTEEPLGVCWVQLHAIRIIQRPRTGCPPTQLQEALKWIHEHQEEYADMPITGQWQRFKAQVGKPNPASQRTFTRASAVAAAASKCISEHVRGLHTYNITLASDVAQQKFITLLTDLRPKLLSLLVSFDTAEVTVSVEGEPVTLHVAGAITAAGGCWLFPQALPPLHGGQQGGNYSTGSFVEVLKALRTAVRSEELVMMPADLSALQELARGLAVIWPQQQQPAKQQQAAAEHAAGSLGSSLATRHYKNTNRGGVYATSINKEMLAGLAEDCRPFLLVMDCASQHTSLPALDAYEVAKQSIIQLSSAGNPIERLWRGFKAAAAQQVYSSEHAAMEALQALWHQQKDAAVAEMAGWQPQIKVRKY